MKTEGIKTPKKMGYPSIRSDVRLDRILESFFEFRNPDSKQPA